MKERLITAIVAGAVFITVLILGGYWYGATIMALALIGYYEFVRLHGYSFTEWPSLLGALSVAVLTAKGTILSFDWLPDFQTTTWLLTFVLLAATVISKNRIQIRQIAVLLIGVLYIGIGFQHMLLVRSDEQFGLLWTIMIFAAIWMADTGAYLAGRAFGKHPLWPVISPNKTIEGLVGGVLLSLLTACAFAWFWPEQVHYSQAILVALCAALIGQMGDLIQSAYKRAAGVKDSGKLFPGHGGVLDRCDSWLIVFPFLYMLVL